MISQSNGEEGADSAKACERGMDCRYADGTGACAEFETGYFQGRVNEATEQIVVTRNGTPQKIEQREDDQTV